MFSITYVCVRVHDNKCNSNKIQCTFRLYSNLFLKRFYRRPRTYFVKKKYVPEHCVFGIEF